MKVILRSNYDMDDVDTKTVDFGDDLDTENHGAELLDYEKLRCGTPGRRK